MRNNYRAELWVQLFVTNKEVHSNGEAAKLADQAVVEFDKRFWPTGEPRDKGVEG